MKPAQQIHTAETNSASDQIGRGASPMWGFSLEFWESVFFGATTVAAIAGAIAVTSAFVAGIVGYQVTDRVLKVADGKIAEANARGEEAKLESAKALEEANKAAENLAGANERAAQANERAAHAEQKAAEANLALEKFKAPRVLTTQEQQLIVSKVSKFVGQEYAVTTFWDLKEPLNFTNQLHQTLLMAGWKFIPPGEGGAFLLGGLSGVQVWVHPDADPKVKDAANALVSALEEIGKAPTLKLQNPKNSKGNKIALNVGTKP